MPSHIHFRSCVAQFKEFPWHCVPSKLFTKDQINTQCWCNAIPNSVRMSNGRTIRFSLFIENYIWRPEPDWRQWFNWLFVARLPRRWSCGCVGVFVDCPTNWLPDKRCPSRNGSYLVNEPRECNTDTELRTRSVDYPQSTPQFTAEFQALKPHSE